MTSNLEVHWGYRVLTHIHIFKATNSKSIPFFPSTACASSCYERCFLSKLLRVDSRNFSSNGNSGPHWRRPLKKKSGWQVHHVIPTSKISVYYHYIIKHLGFPTIFDDEIPQIWDTFVVAFSGGKADGELRGGGAGEGGAPWLSWFIPPIPMVYDTYTCCYYSQWNLQTNL